MRSAVSLFVTFLVCLSGSTVFAAPVLKFDNPVFDFGKVFQGEKVRHTFSFTNAGDETLKIDRVRSSCGCTAALLSEKSILPGEKGEVQTNFDSARFRGAVSKTIYLYSNDQVRPTMQLHVKGKVMEIVAVEPAQVNFGEVSAGKTVSAKVVLRNQGGKPLTLGKPNTTAVELVAKTLPASFADGDEVTVDLELTPKPGHSRFSGYVLVPIDGVPKNELRIPVYATMSR